MAMGVQLLTLLLIAFIALLRKWFSGGVCRCKGHLKGKTIVITGANAGIGKETAKLLAQRGARVILACRDVNSANAVVDEVKGGSASADISAMYLDLASFDSIRTFAQQFRQNERQLHILINNAGIYYHPEALTEDGHDLVFQTNYLGHFLLTTSLLDVIKSSCPSRVINVSSAAYARYPHVDYFTHTIRTYDRNFVYAKSKLAQILFTKTLAKQLQGSGVSVNALHPGMVDTNIFKNFPTLSHPLIRPLIKLTFKSALQGAQTTLHCAVSEQCATVTGCYFKDCSPFPLESFAQDDRLADELWSRSVEMCRIKNS